jgi:hypothetical protein
VKADLQKKQLDYRLAGMEKASVPAENKGRSSSKNSSKGKRRR